VSLSWFETRTMILDRATLSAFRNDSSATARMAPTIDAKAFWTGG